jgi:hypothetical protein
MSPTTRRGRWAASKDGCMKVVFCAFGEPVIASILRGPCWIGPNFPPCDIRRQAAPGLERRPRVPASCGRDAVVTPAPSARPRRRHRRAHRVLGLAPVGSLLRVEASHGPNRPGFNRFLCSGVLHRRITKGRITKERVG